MKITKDVESTHVKENSGDTVSVFATESSFISAKVIVRLVVPSYPIVYHLQEKNHH